MSGYHIQNGSLYADNVALSDIAEQFGTPTYVYSASVIRKQYEALTEALQKAMPADRQPMLCYAAKANSNIAILKLLQGLGSGLEIVSEGELRRGLKAGFTGEQMISTSFGKTDIEVRACLEAGIHQLNIESVPELDMMNRVAGEMNKKPAVVFRLNPNIDGGGHHKTMTGTKRNKFGLSAERILELYAYAEGLDHIEPAGLSMHIGSQVLTVEAFKPAFEAMSQLVKDLRAKGHTVSRLDIGGGFPVIYKDEKLLDLQAYADWVRDIILPLDTEIQMEPGRYMVANAGTLLTRTTYVKDVQHKSFLVLDAGMNDLIRPTLYEAYHGIRPVQNLDRPEKLYDVVGPICESGDVFTEGRSIPEMRDGELAVIESAGAYGFAMASNYNSRVLPAEVLVDGDKLSIIRERQTFDEMMRGEIIPEWL